MCDTLGIGPNYTSSGISIFGKNSDREADETQLVLSIARKVYPEHQDLRCTYITIPQAGSTHAVVLSKPFWLWGAEMGVNEKGVAIGNEALFTRVKPEKEPGLIGMDLLRLALERAATADEAANIIIDLLIKYGQAGPCGYRDKKFSYMNSFIIMDPKSILTLETVGRDYAMKRHADHAVISNMITTTADWDRSSLPKGTDLSTFTDPLTTYFAGSTCRKGQGDAAILKAKGTISVNDVFQMLRSHYNHTPGKGFNHDVCMHASDPLIRRSQTTGSMVVELYPDDKIRIFVTAGSAPCLTPFKPFMPAAPFMDTSRGAEHYAEDSYWWRHEVYHINALFRYNLIWPLVQERIREQETQWAADMPAHEWDSKEVSLKDTSHGAFAQSEHMEKTMLDQMMGIKRQAFSVSNLFWRHMARRSGVPMV
jgi:secernin